MVNDELRGIWKETVLPRYLDERSQSRQPGTLDEIGAKHLQNASPIITGT
jgi:hypothetical protein